MTTLAAGSYTWYTQHAATGVGASEASASAYVSMTEYTLSVAASQVNTDWVIPAAWRRYSTNLQS